ncbi:MAG: hypothetical protein ACREXW_03140 [Gammaproteobacteria bacterium]
MTPGASCFFARAWTVSVSPLTWSSYSCSGRSAWKGAAIIRRPAQDPTVVGGEEELLDEDLHQGIGVQRAGGREHGRVEIRQDVGDVITTDPEALPLGRIGFMSGVLDSCRWAEEGNYARWVIIGRNQFPHGEKRFAKQRTV